MELAKVSGEGMIGREIPEEKWDKMKEDYSKELNRLKEEFLELNKTTITWIKGVTSSIVSLPSDVSTKVINAATKCREYIADLGKEVFKVIIEND